MNRYKIILTLCFIGFMIFSCMTDNTIKDSTLISQTLASKEDMSADTVSTSETSNTEPETTTNNTDSWDFSDSSMVIHIDKVQSNDLTYFVADIQLTDISQLQTALAYSRLDSDYRQNTSDIAESNHAIFAVNGDYSGYRNYGIIIRNGILYRNIPSGNDLLIIDQKGNFTIENEKNIDADSLISDGVLQTLSFGPGLIINGDVQTFNRKYGVSTKKEPRTGIGQLGNLHYLFIVVDGRNPGYSDGITLEGLASLFEQYGCQNAYNLDGGGSSTLYFNGEVLNKVSGGTERAISDILYIPEY